MQFTDRMLKCVACSKNFIFSAEEQIFFFDKGFTNDPKRCKGCKAQRFGVSRRVLLETKIACSVCGSETTVPFKPTQGRPVLCRSCFCVQGATLPET